MAEWLVCVTLKLKVTDSNLSRNLFFANSRFMNNFSYLAFCRVLACVCEAKLRFCVNLSFPRVANRKMSPQPFNNFEN